MTTPVRAVFFDAVGTLIHPAPSAAQAYHLAGQRHGSPLPLEAVSARFAHAFRAEDEVDARHGHRTSEARESERWRRIVAAVLDDVRDLEACFVELYDHFASPANWRCEAGAGAVIDRLARSGLVIGMASNFDRRLRGVVEGMAELAGLDHLAISSEVGWKKPAGAFYSALEAMTGLAAGEILIVGDDLENDVLAPRRCGMRAVLFDPRTRSRESERIRVLGEVIGRVTGESGSSGQLDR